MVRPLALWLAMLLVAGCSSSGRATPPAPAATSVLPSAASTGSPTPASTPTEPPPTPFACPPLPSAVDASFALGVATGVVVMPLEPGVAVDPAASFAPIDPGDIVIEGTALGGTELRGTITIDELADDPSIAITAMTARFVPLDASSSSAVGVTPDGADAVITLPNRDADGRLMLEVDWSSSCGSGSAGGEIALTVVNSKVAAGCPTTDDAVFAALQDLGKLRITIGGLSEPLDIISWQTRWMPGNGVDDFGTLFPNWDRGAVITVAPGANVAVREKVDGLDLVSVRAPIYARADVDTYFETDAFPDPVTVVRRNVNPKGNVNIPAPLDPGSYVFDVQATWRTSCFELQTTRSVSVKVS